MTWSGGVVLDTETWMVDKITLACVDAKWRAFTSLGKVPCSGRRAVLEHQGEVSLGSSGSCSAMFTLL